jgi:hypothetical protein
VRVGVDFTKLTQVLKHLHDTLPHKDSHVLGKVP